MTFYSDGDLNTDGKVETVFTGIIFYLFGFKISP